MVTKIRTRQTEEPGQTLEDEFKYLHLNLSVLEVLLAKWVRHLSKAKRQKGWKYPGLITLPCRLGTPKTFDTLADLGSCVNIIPLYLFKNLNIGLLEETDHVFGFADGIKSYPVGIVRDVEVHIGRLKLLNDLLVGRGFLATANAVIDYRKAKIAVGEGITRSVFGVKGIKLGEEEAPYWTTLGKRESYEPRPSSDGVGAKTPYYARKEFMDSHLPGEREIARDVEISPFKIEDNGDNAYVYWLGFKKRSPSHSTPLAQSTSSSTPYLKAHYVNYEKISSCHQTFLKAITSEREHVNLAEAVKDKRWQSAIDSELEALEQNKTWTIEKLPPNKKALGCKWVYKIKYKSDGTTERFKARLVILDNHQVTGFDYSKTFVPIAKIVSVQVFLAIATTKQWELHQMDVHNALLHGDLEEVFMKLPPGLHKGQPWEACKL
ncbi:MAK10-like protein, partial [Tanacetum coccineum]